MANKERRTFRVRQLPDYVKERNLPKLLQNLLSYDGTSDQIDIFSLAPSIDSFGKQPTQVATVRFETTPAALPEGRNNWVFPKEASNLPYNILIDTHFLGLTVLNHVEEDKHKTDCFAISGLASHPFGSWKARDTDHDINFMWLRDALPKQHPSIRCIIYGYDTHLPQSHSFKNIEDISRTLVAQLVGCSSRSTKPLFFLAHSLGGIVLKQALVQMSSGSDSDKSLLSRVAKIVLFGVPNRGMRVSHLQPMVQGQSNTSLVECLSDRSQYLGRLDEQFTDIPFLRGARVISIYETLQSQIPRLSPETGLWARDGPYEVLVEPGSAIHRSSKQEDIHPVDKDHSNLVKFSEDDSDLNVMLRFLEESDLAPVVDPELDSRRAGKLADQESTAAHGRNINAREALGGGFEYSDTQNNDYRHRSVATEAAAYAEEIPSAIARSSVFASPKVDHPDALISWIMPKLYVTDPRNDKSRLIDDKGKLLKPSFAWVLNDRAFLDWRDGEDTHLLWIKGHPGKGKTMMCIGLIDELSAHLQQTSGRKSLSYFFCQSQFNNLNNPVSVLKGIIWLLIEQNRAFLHRLRRKFAVIGRDIFEGPNALYALWGVLQDIIDDSSYGTLFIVIDAVDECDQGGLDVLLNFIAESRKGSPQRVKWLLTSRHSFDTQRWLGCKIDDRFLISLEANAVKVTEAVDAFIDSNVQALAILKKYNNDLQDEMKLDLRQKAEGTFLWVSLVCKRLKSVSRHNTKSVIAQFPAGLVPLYERMLHMMLHSEDDEQVRCCKMILQSAVSTYSPLHVKEMGGIAGLPKELSHDYDYQHELVDQCGSFLKISEDTVSFVHESAKEYLGANRRKFSISQPHEEHLMIAIRCMDIMLGTLKENMGVLDSPGSALSNAQADVVRDVVAQCGYSTCFWIDHLRQSSQRGADSLTMNTPQVERFLRSCFLHWCEMLCLMGEVPRGRKALQNLAGLVHPSAAPDLCNFVSDATRFYVTYTPVISLWPLQIYHSALVFSPQQSLVKQQYQGQYLNWISVAPQPEGNQPSKLQVLEGHLQAANTVAFSPNGKMIASGSLDKSIKIWNAEAGTLSKTLKGHSLGVTGVAFSPDNELLASASDDITVKIWAVATGALLRTLDGHLWKVSAVMFSPVGNYLASASCDDTIRLWDVATGSPRGVLKGHSHNVNVIAFSPDGKEIASASSDKSIKLWDLEALMPISLLEGHTSGVTALSMSKDGRLLVSGSRDKTIRVWDLATKGSKIIVHHTDPITAVALSADSTMILFASNDSAVRILDMTNEASPVILTGHQDRVSSVSFSPDGKLVASASWDKTVILWSSTNEDMTGSHEGGSWNVSAIALSPDCRFAASAYGNPEVTLWDTATGAELHRSKMKRPVWEVSFSDDQRQIHTNQGSVFIGHLVGRCGTIRPDISTHIDVQDQWIIWRKKKMIWLPMECRTAVFAVRGNTVALACRSGQVVIMVLDQVKAAERRPFYMALGERK